jgi:hypothetical protein
LQVVRERGIMMAAAQDLSSLQYLYFFITANAPEEGHAAKEQLLMIKLPNHPTTVDELRVIRAWLHTLARTHFSSFCKDVYSNDGFFNPTVFRLLFPSPGPTIKLQFHADFILYPEASVEDLTKLAPHICAGNIEYWRERDTPESLLELASSSHTIPASFEINGLVQTFDDLQCLVKVSNFIFITTLKKTKSKKKKIYYKY